MRFHLRSLVSFLLPVLSFANPEYTNNAPFSVAIYIVSPDGQPITVAVANVCPSFAAVSCSTLNQPSWCCPASYTCAEPANAGGLIGCCPAGSSCGGVINAASISTVTVQTQQQTTVVYAQPPVTTVAANNQPTQVVNQGEFCSTMTASGPGLPAARQGQCGTILVMNEAPAVLKPQYLPNIVLFCLLLAIRGLLS